MNGSITIRSSANGTVTFETEQNGDTACLVLNPGNALMLGNALRRAAKGPGFSVTFDAVGVTKRQEASR